MDTLGRLSADNCRSAHVEWQLFWLAKSVAMVIVSTPSLNAGNRPEFNAVSLKMPDQEWVV
jgi:hypothetical protein